MICGWLNRWPGKAAVIGFAGLAVLTATDVYAQASKGVRDCDGYNDPRCASPSPRTSSPPPSQPRYVPQPSRPSAPSVTPNYGNIYNPYPSSRPSYDDEDEDYEYRRRRRAREQEEFEETQRIEAARRAADEQARRDAVARIEAMSRINSNNAQNKRSDEENPWSRTDHDKNANPWKDGRTSNKNNSNPWGRGRAEQSEDRSLQSCLTVSSSGAGTLVENGCEKKINFAFCYAEDGGLFGCKPGPGHVIGGSDTVAPKAKDYIASGNGQVKIATCLPPKRPQFADSSGKYACR